MFGVLACSTAATIFSDSAALRPNGFSHITILPASAAAMAISAWVSFGLAMSMRSISFRATSLRQSVSNDEYPQLPAKLSASAGFRAQTATSAGSCSRSKNLLTFPNALEWVRPIKPQPTMPTLSFFVAPIKSLRDESSLPPAVGVAHLDHGAKDVVPGLLTRHSRIGEHATVPADVPKGLRQRAVVVPQPIPGVMNDIELAVRVIDRAVPTGLVVAPGAPDRRVVLRDVKIDRPGAQRMCHCLERGFQAFSIFPVEIPWKYALFWGVEAQCVKQGMRHVGLKSEGLRAPDGLQQIDHALPALHAAPADLAFRRQSLAMRLRNVASFAERFCDQFGAGGWILRPFMDARRRIDANDPVRPHAELAQLFCDGAGFLDHSHVA